mgnify:CR=1 FL=1
MKPFRNKIIAICLMRHRNEAIQSGKIFLPHGTSSSGQKQMNCQPSKVWFILHKSAALTNHRPKCTVSMIFYKILINSIVLQIQSGTEYGPFVGNEHFPELNKALDEKGAKYGVSANAIATAWVLRHPAKIQIVLGSMNPTRLGEMLDGADIDLDKQDWWDLYVAAGNLIP